MPESRQTSVDPVLARVFADEVGRQYERLIRSIDQVNAILRNESSEHRAFWFYIDAAMAAIAKISKCFWPSGHSKVAKQRCAMLRQHWDIREDSGVQVRAVRDSLEHFDERIDTWFAESTSKNFLSEVVAPSGAIGGVDPSDYARHFDPVTKAVSVFARVQALDDLINEVEEIVRKVAPSAIATGSHSLVKRDGHDYLTISDATYRLTDLVYTLGSFDNISFTNCRLEGPIVLAVQGNVVLVDCSFAEPIEAIFIEVEEGRPLTGVVSAADTEFTGCLFERVAFVGAHGNFPQLGLDRDQVTASQGSSSVPVPTDSGRSRSTGDESPMAGT